jgi:hypothetical protein
MKNDNDKEVKYYLETDDTIDVGKEPLPLSEQDRKVLDKVKAELNLK